MKRFPAATLVLLSALLAGCASMSEPSKQEMILGAWEASFQGQSFTLTYSDSEVTIGDVGMSFPYEWVDDDHIRLDALGQSVVTEVQFTNPDEMVQRSDQGVQTLRRTD